MPFEGLGPRGGPLFLRATARFSAHRGSHVGRWHLLSGTRSRRKRSLPSVPRP